jgi:hypothetical protein
LDTFPTFFSTRFVIKGVTSLLDRILLLSSPTQGHARLLAAKDAEEHNKRGHRAQPVTHHRKDRTEFFFICKRINPLNNSILKADEKN